MCRFSFWAVLVAASSAATASAGRVDLEAAVESGFPPADLQRWNQMLGQAGFDGVRIGGSTTLGGAGANRILVEPFEVAGGTSYKVYGVLTRNNQLIVPSGRFGLGDRAALAAWVTKVRTSGVPLRPGEKAPPFGLKPEMLDLVKRDLARVADFSTQNRRVVEVLNDLGNRVQHQVSADPTLGDALTRAEKIPGELKGLACGTVAAATLRREGLSLVPKTVAGKIEYHVVRAAKDEDVWPVGWTPEQPIPELLPDLFTLRPVQIDGVPASQLLQVVADRLKLPMLFDEQALVLKKLDPTKVLVNIPEGKIGYEAVLDRAMYQASLKHEVRVDDAGKPFLWITSR